MKSLNLLKGEITWKKVLFILLFLLLYDIISNAPDSIDSFQKGVDYCLQLGKID
jgi:hypothetical protein